MIPSDYESDPPESLLRHYRLSGAEGPLRQLIARYLPLVFSAALRRTGSGTLAADVTQSVICDFARQARSLPANFQPGGWLLRHTGFLASRALRSERRRVARETEAARRAQLETTMTASSSRHTELDAAMRRLAVADQTILVLKYYEEQEAPDIAARLGISASAAQKRIERALHRLRRRMPGTPAVQVITAGIAGMLSPDSARAAMSSSLLPSLTAPALAAAALPLSRAAVWLCHLSPAMGTALGTAAALLIAAGPLISYISSPPAASRSAVSRLASNQNQKPAPDEEKLTPDKAKSLLEIARRIKNIDERSSACRDIIKQLCLAGYSKEAFDLIEAGDGQVRTWELTVYFEHTSLELPEMIRQMESLPYQGEGASALGSWWNSRSPEEVLSSLHVPALKEFTGKIIKSQPDVLKNLLEGYLLGRVVYAENNEEKKATLDTAIAWNEKGIISGGGIGQVLMRTSGYSAFEKWGVISDVNAKASRQSFDKHTRAAIIENMVKEDAPRALTHIAQTISPQAAKNAQITDDFSTAVFKFGSADSVSASRWFEENKAGLSAPLRDAAANGFFQLALRLREFDGARQWAQQIVNPELKQEALKRLEQ